MVEPTTSRSKHKIKYFTAEIRGTTFTGHPTRTTLGNTLRMMFYTKFLAYKANVEIASCHAGDDVVVVIGKENAEKFKDIIKGFVRTERVEDLIKMGYTHETNADTGEK